MTCWNCGTENRAGARFCIECAAPYPTGCPTCGTKNPPTARFCSECATPLQDVTGPAGASANHGIPGGHPEAGLAPRGSSGAARGSSGAAPAAAVSVQATPSGGATPTPTAATSAAPTAVADPPVIEERRLVTVLFADLVGFTPFAEERDVDEVREVLTRYFDLASEVVARYGGVVEKFIGDAVMAVWGAPVTREDDAERAVRAALELVDAVDGMDRGIRARAGVLSGEAAVTIGAPNEGMVVGDLVNTASRLQTVAAPGTVLVGESTQRAAAGAIVFEPAGEQVLKGKQAPVRAWTAVRVVAQRGGRNRAEMLEPPFVGRAEELRLLKELFHATGREGKSRLVSIVGPAGIGKTRLAWEFVKYVDGLVERVWWHSGRSAAFGDDTTFGALGDMVRTRAGLAETDDEEVSRERIAATVREHVPDEDERRWVEAALLALLGVDREGAGTRDGAGIPTDQLFTAWRTFFERLAATSPVVLVFEELHHADSGLLDFIEHVMEWSRALPIMIVTLARGDLTDRRPKWGAATRAFTSIHLDTLTDLEMEQLLAGVVSGLSQTAVDRIVARADGVPLYAVETVRMLIAQGRLLLEGDVCRPVGSIDELAVPETLTALIAARLDALDARDRNLLEDAAVLGHSFSVAALAAVSGGQQDALEPRLRELVRRELLVLDADPRSPERGKYAFVQALIREVAYNTLPKKARKLRHLAAARWFEALATEERAAGLASHYLAAQRLAVDDNEARTLADQARTALVNAAERSSALGSHEQARLFLEQALDMTAEPAGRADLHGRAMQEALNGLDPEPVVEHAAAAEAEWRKTGDREGIAMAAATHATVLNSVRNDPVTALAMIERAWDEFSDLEPTEAGIELMSTMVRVHRALGHHAEALTWVERYMPIAERLEALPAVARGILGRGISLAVSGRPREGIVLLRGAHDLALANALQEVELTCRVLLTFYAQWGEPVQGLALGREGLEVGRRLGSRSYGFQMVGNTSICGLRVGDWDGVAALLDEWLELETGEARWVELHVDRAVLRAFRGEDPTADLERASRLRTDMTDTQYESYELFARAAGSLAAGKLDEAIEQAERTVAKTDFFAPLAYPLAARAALWARSVEPARRINDALAAAGFWGPALAAERARIQAGIAALEERPDEALAGFRDALSAFRELGLAFDEAATALDAAVLLPAPQREAADMADAFDTAATTLRRLGATPFVARLEAAVR